MSDQTKRVRFEDPRAWVAFMIIALFAWAYWRNPDSDVLLGALISAFNLAIGFYLGSSRSAVEHSHHRDVR